MRTENSNHQPVNKKPDPLSGYFYTLIILAFLVAALVIVENFVTPPFETLIQQQALVTSTFPLPSQTPAATEYPETIYPMQIITPAESTPPVVNISWIIFIGGGLVLIVLLAVLREISWFRR